MLGHSSGRFLEEQAGWPQALIQNPRAASRWGASFGGLVILFMARGGRRRGIGGGPGHHARLTTRERLDGPSVPSLSHTRFPGSAWLRVARNVPSNARVRADYLAPCAATQSAAALVIEADSISMIGRRRPDGVAAPTHGMAARRKVTHRIPSGLPTTPTSLDRRALLWSNGGWGWGFQFSPDQVCQDRLDLVAAGT